VSELLQNINNPAIILLLAVILDFLIGDPEYKFHPIRLIGYLINRLERFFRRITNNQRFNGFVFLIVIVVTVLLFAYYLTNLWWPFDLFLVYSSLAVKDLRDKASEIEELLSVKNITEARKSLSMIVGRDTEDLDEKEIARATIETVAENFTDGIVSPIFWYAIGGTPFMLAYKAVNTLDSMVGYKNQEYKDFGFASAKIDDFLNFLPARLTYFLIPLSGLFLRLNYLRSIKIGLRDGQKNPSPNSGISEALVAGLLGIQLGGTNFYFGEKFDKPKIGDATKEIEIDDIGNSINIVYTGTLFLTIFVLLILTISG